MKRVEELLFLSGGLDDITASREIRDEMTLVRVKVYFYFFSGQNTKCNIAVTYFRTSF